MSTKPWILYNSKQEIGEVIQKRLAERLKYPVGFAIKDEEFLFIIKLPGNAAHIRCQLQDLKKMYKTPEDFVAFIEDCWDDSVRDVTKKGTNEVE